MKIFDSKEVKFVAQIEDVKELRLIGSANLDFWNNYLSGEPFQAFAAAGCAEITIGATELVWKKIRFNELTVSLTIADEADAQKPIGYFLLHAFNSNRFFAFCERVFFSTPYYFGKVQLRETMTRTINAGANNQNVFKAGMINDSAEKEIRDDWEGAVFLSQNKYFVAKLTGKSKVRLFSDSDRLEVNSNDRFPIFKRLIDSEFKGREWRMRSRAFHAKSKTYRLRKI